MEVWHYTTGQKFSLILASGVLLPTAVGVKPPERPILWFSAEPYWEPTASKALLLPTGEIRPLSMQETAKCADGLYRFGYDRTRLHAGGRLRQAARMRQRVWQGLCAEGLRQQANPSLWLGSTQGIPLTAITRIETMREDGAWEPVRL